MCVCIRHISVCMIYCNEKNPFLKKYLCERERQDFDWALSTS